MAAKKKTSQSAAAKKAAETRKLNKEKKELEQAQNHARQQVSAVLMFAAGLLLMALTIISGQKLWRTIHDALFGLFGWSAVLIGPIFIYIAVCAAMDKPVGAIRHKVWQTLVLVALISGVTQIFVGGEPEAESFMGICGELYEQGKALKGGGLVSVLFALWLLKLFGTLGAGIIIFLLIFVFVMIISRSTLIDLFNKATRPVKKIEESYIEHIEEKKRGGFNIDVPVDNDPPAPAYEAAQAAQAPPVMEPDPMPMHPVFSPPGSMDGAQTLLKAKDRLLNLDEDMEATERAAEEAQSRLADEAGPKVVTDPRPVPIDDIIRKFDSQNPEKKLEQAMEDVSAPRPAPIPIDPQEKLAVVESEEGLYSYPPINLLTESKRPNVTGISDELKSTAQHLVETLKSFGVNTTVLDISRGPAVTRYELQPSSGVKISKITSLADDIALNLAASGVRIEAPIPNKAAVGIEVPNKVISTVTIREIIDSNDFVKAESRLTVALGKDIAGHIALADIAKMPHVLIAGATGSGKSVCINSIIISLLFKSSPDEVKFLMIDPKVVELGGYNGIPHLLVPVVTDPKKAAGALGWAVTEMLKRYKLFAASNVRDLKSFNLLAETKEDLSPMPQIVIIIDELADLMMAAPNDVEDHICRLAQMARAAGMHLVIATQRPSVDVITGVIKANIPSRIAFAVSSQVDSRTILDSGGAEKLLGRGDMLFYPMGAAKPVRVQGCFVTEKEVDKVVTFIKEGGEKAAYSDDILEEIDRQAASQKKSKGSDGGGFEDEDVMLPAAIECVVEAGQASTSLLQRRLKLGYARAARLVDEMEEKGIVGPFEGSKPRQVLISRERWIEMKLNNSSQTGRGGESDGSAPIL